MQHKSALGPSKLPYKFWKKCGALLKQYILALFNQCLSQGSTPKNWLQSELILLPKPKDWEGNLNLA